MITSSQMRALEREAQAHGILKDQLMENAGKETARNLHEHCDLIGKRIVIFAGVGDNGGDGLVAARYLSKDNNVIIFLCGDKEKMSEDAQNKYILIKKTIPVVHIRTPDDLHKVKLQPHLPYIFIDALIGIGLQGDIREPIISAIKFFNENEGYKVALDVPSGLDADTGSLTTPHTNVDLIITLHDLKTGLVELRDKTIIIDIGLGKK